MLVKLAFVMQRLKKYLNNFCHDQQRWGGNFSILWGDTAVMRGDIALMGVPQSPLPPDFTLTDALVTGNTNNQFVSHRFRVKERD